jgi:hypothetical protein
LIDIFDVSDNLNGLKTGFSVAEISQMVKGKHGEMQQSA